MDNRPVIVGVGSIQQKGNYKSLDEALILMDIATKKAIKDTNNEDIKNFIEEIHIPKGYWRYRDPGKWIATKNNFKDVKTSVYKIGVLQQNLLNSCCNKILNKEIGASLIVGGEARYKLLLSQIKNKDFKEIELNENPNFYVKAKDDIHLDEEKAELGMMAVGYYAILESAFRFNKNISIENQSDFVAEMYAYFSKVASRNKDAWTDSTLDANEIKNITKKNSLQAFPYNKYHCTSWNVNQSAAIIVCSEKIADDLDIPQEKRVYPLASSENNHMIGTLQRPKLYEQHGMQLAAKYILDVCQKLKIEPNFYDLYSCFPVAVQMFAESLNLNDYKKFTITGGMSFAGGPLNSYVLHSLAKMVSKIRKTKDSSGIVTGVSGMMTKQSYALLSSNPLMNFTHKDFTEFAAKKEKPVEISSLIDGTGIVIGYTILNKTEENYKAVIFIDCSDNKRKLITSDDMSIIKSMENKEWVGKKVYFKKNQLVS